MKDIQLCPDRVPAFALAEIAFLVALTSTDKGLSQLAAQGLRFIAQAESQVGAPKNPGMAEEERFERHPIYDQLGDPHVIVVGKTENSYALMSAELKLRRTRRTAEANPETHSLHSICITYSHCCLGGMLLAMAIALRNRCADAAGSYSRRRVSSTTSRSIVVF